MVKIQLSTGFLDVKEGTAFPLNFQVGDIRDISKRQGNFSKTITLTGSKNNNNLLNHYYDVNIVEGTFNINALTTCSVIQDGLPIMEDCSMQLTGVVKSQVTDGYEEQVTYEVLIKDSKADFFTAIANKELTDIDFSDFNHTFDSTNVVGKFANTTGYKYYLPQSSDAVYQINEFKPAIFAKTYFDRIFEDAGFTYSWPTINYDRFEKLFIPYNGEIDNLDYQDYIVKANRSAFSFTGIGTNGIPIIPDNLITALTETEDQQNLFNPVTGVYSTPMAISNSNSQYFEYQITIQYDIQMVNNHASTCFSAAIQSGTSNTRVPNLWILKPTLTVQNGINQAQQAILSNTTFSSQAALAGFFGLPFSLAPGTTTILGSNTAFVTIQTTAPLLPQFSGLTLRLGVPTTQYNWSGVNLNSTKWRVGSINGATATLLVPKINITSVNISILPSSNIQPSGGILNVNDYVPKKIKQSDFIKGIFNMYNIYAQVDNTQPNKLNLMHRDAFYDSGAEVDWTAKLAKDQEQNLSFLPELTSKKLILTYAADKDSPNEVYTSATSNIYGQAEVIFDNEYVKEVTTKPVLFGPTPVIRTPFNAYVPMIAGAAPQTNLRILYNGGMAPCGPYTIIDFVTPGTNPPYVGTTSTTYPISGHFDNPLSPTFDINFAVCSYYYYTPNSLTDNNLYNRYWRRTMGQINNGKMLTALFNLKEPDIQAMKLNDKIRIDNSWWNINKVIDYDANAHKLTKVELISIDTEINFHPFISSLGPGVGLPAISAMMQQGSHSIMTTRSTYNNAISNANDVTIVGRGNAVGVGLRAMVIADNAQVNSSGLYVDDLTVIGTINGRAVETPPIVYIANLSQVGIFDPAAREIVNAFGEILWTRTGVGTYEGVILDYPLGAILNNEITVIINNVAFDGVVSATYTVSSNTISVTTSQIGVGFADGYLTDTTIEVKYYI